MLVPEASVDEDHLFPRKESNIRTTGELFSVDSKSVSHRK